MTQTLKPRVGVTGSALFSLRLPVQQHGSADLTSSTEITATILKQTQPLAASQITAGAQMTVGVYETPLDGPLKATARHRSGGLKFFFDNRGETPIGLITRNEGEILQYDTKDLNFVGADKSMRKDAEGKVTVYIPAQSFEPTFQLRFIGGTYNNQVFAEKGYEASGLSYAWASNDPVALPIIAADQVRLDGLDIVLDNGWTVTAGGILTPGAPLSEAIFGSGGSVRLHSVIETVTLTDTLSWRWRVYHGNHAFAAMDQPTIKTLSNSSLATSRNGTRAFVTGADLYKWICYPTAFGYAAPLDNFVDTETNFKVPMEEPQTIPMTNVFGATTNYYAYRTTFKVGGAINVRVS